MNDRGPGNAFAHFKKNTGNIRRFCCTILPTEITRGVSGAMPISCLKEIADCLPAESNQAGSMPLGITSTLPGSNPSHFV